MKLMRMTLVKCQRRVALPWPSRITVDERITEISYIVCIAVDIIEFEIKKTSCHWARTCIRRPFHRSCTKCLYSSPAKQGAQPSTTTGCLGPRLDAWSKYSTNDRISSWMITTRAPTAYEHAIHKVKAWHIALLSSCRSKISHSQKGNSQSLELHSELRRVVKLTASCVYVVDSAYLILCKIWGL